MWLINSTTSNLLILIPLEKKKTPSPTDLMFSATKQTYRNSLLLESTSFMKWRFLLSKTIQYMNMFTYALSIYYSTLKICIVWREAFSHHYTFNIHQQFYYVLIIKTTQIHSIRRLVHFKSRIAITFRIHNVNKTVIKIILLPIN